MGLEGCIQDHNHSGAGHFSNNASLALLPDRAAYQTQTCWLLP
jgi:hypothetical protein